MGTVSPVIPLDIDRQVINAPRASSPKQRGSGIAPGVRYMKSEGQTLRLFF